MLDTRYFSYFQTNIDYKYPQPMFKNGFKAVLTSTHNLYFIAKTKKLMYYAYPCYNIVKLVYIFLIFALGHISWLLIHNVYPRSMFERKKKKRKKKTKKKNKKKTDHYFSYANNHFYSRDILQYIARTCYRNSTVRLSPKYWLYSPVYVGHGRKSKSRRQCFLRHYVNIYVPMKPL